MRSWGGYWNGDLLCWRHWECKGGGFALLQKGGERPRPLEFFDYSVKVPKDLQLGDCLVQFGVQSAAGLFPCCLNGEDFDLKFVDFASLFFAHFDDLLERLLLVVFDDVAHCVFPFWLVVGRKPSSLHNRGERVFFRQRSEGNTQ